MTANPNPTSTGRLKDWQISAMSLAAAASALGDKRATNVQDALDLDLPRAAAIGPDAADVLSAEWPERFARSSAMVSFLGQISKAANDQILSWAEQPEPIITAQGESSALMARKIVSDVLPAYDDVCEDELEEFLDVGTGIGAIAVTIAELLPEIRVTGLDISSRALDIASSRQAALPPSIASRISYRLENVSDLHDQNSFDIAWIPAPFLPEDIMDDTIRRVRRSLRPEGLVIVGTNPDETRTPGAAWLAAQTGGSAETTRDAERRLEAAGMVDIRRFPTVPHGPVLVAGRTACAARH